MASSDRDILIQIRAANLTAEAFDKVQAGLQSLRETSAHTTHEGSEGFTSWFATIAGGVASGELLAHALEKVGEIGLEAFTKAAEALPELIAHTAETGNKLYEMSLKTGVSVETLSKLRYVASQTGIEFDSFGTTLFKMQKFLGATGQAAVEAQAHLDVLGLNLQTLKNEKPDEAFIDIISALEKIPNRAEQAAAGAAIFGKGFKDMAGLAQEDIHGLITEAETLGLVMTTETAAAAHAAEVGFKSLEMQLESVGMRIGSAFLPAIIGLEHNISEVLAESIRTANDGLDEMGGADGFLATVAKAMGTGNGAIAAQVTLYEALRDTLISVVRNGVEPFLTAFGFVMVEVNAAKVVFGDIAQVIDGVRLAFMLTQQSAALGLLPGSAVDLQKWKALDEQIGRLELKMKQRGTDLQDDKRNEQDWSDGAVKANANIEAALNKLGSTHTDVARIIEDFAKRSRSAYGGAGADVDGFDKKAEKAAEDLQHLVEHVSGVDVARQAAQLDAAMSAVAKAGLLNASAQRILADAAAKLFKEGATLSPQLFGLVLAFGELNPKVLDTALGIGSLGEKVELAIPKVVDFSSLLPKVVDGFDNIESHLPKLDLGFQFSRANIEIQRATESVGAFEQTLQSIPQTLATSFTGGGGLSGAFNSIGSSLGATLGTTAFTGIRDAMHLGVGKLGEVFAGLGGPIGSVLTSVIGPLFSHFFSTAGRDSVQKFADSFGGFDAMHAALLKQLDGIGEQFWKELTQQVGRGDAAGAAAVIGRIQAALANSPTALAAAAGYQTRAELQAVADKAKSVYDFMLKSGQYTASQLADAFQKSKDAQLAAMDDEARAASDALQKSMDDAKSAVKGFDDQIKSLQDSIANEAPEEVMGIIEAETRAKIKAVEEQRNAAQQALDDTTESAAAAAKKAGDIIDLALADREFKLRVRVILDGLPESGGFTGGTAGVPSHGTGGYFEAPHLAIVGDRPEYITPRESISQLAREISRHQGGGTALGGLNLTVVSKIDGRVAARSVTRYQPDELRRFGVRARTR